MPKRQVKFDLQTIVAMAFVRTISPLKPTSIWQLPTLQNIDPNRKPKHFREANYIMHYFRQTPHPDQLWTY